MPAIGRNDPCPCGSGKKYKRCCLARAEAEVRERGSRDRGVPRALAWLEEHHGARARRPAKEVPPSSGLEGGTTRFLVVGKDVAGIEPGRAIHTCFHAGWSFG